MVPSTPLFFVDADAFLSGQGGAVSPVALDEEGHGDDAAAIRATLDGYHANWLSGIDHAPPWRIMRGGFGFMIAPIRAPDVVDGYQLAPSAVGGGRALSVTLNNNGIAGVRSPTILRLLTQFTLDLAEAMGSRWMGWGPALVAYPPAFMDSQMDAWVRGGLIPLLPFLRFEQADAAKSDSVTDGLRGGVKESVTVTTSGMDFFRLPDIRFTAPHDMHRADAVRRMVRLCYALMADSEAVQDGDFAGLIAGEVLSLRWRKSGAFGVVEVFSRMRGA